MARPKEVSDEAIVAAARRCFLEHGTGISAAEIGRVLGVSHTTLFNRFGSKQDLMIAALAPPKRVSWLSTLDLGPDDRPIVDQLVQLSMVMAEYFEDAQAGLAVLLASGVRPDDVFKTRPIEESIPMQAFTALTAWLKKAQSQERMADCDVEMLASTIIGSLHNRAFAVRMLGKTKARQSDHDYVAKFISLLWNGIGYKDDAPGSRRDRT